ncbi:hypothetical protein N7456_006905 [Penicillium angulare]|uniref:Uncharacterized protein n=1 Tax=Penicillium angulare TaxID=116970 RepID=A0A9W9FII0_9EURO|nr:hypothetical protein N7456_006905 [Penicillium angulare]
MHQSSCAAGHPGADAAKQDPTIHGIDLKQMHFQKRNGDQGKSIMVLAIVVRLEDVFVLGETYHNWKHEYGRNARRVLDSVDYQCRMDQTVTDTNTSEPSVQPPKGLSLKVTNLGGEAEREPDAEWQQVYDGKAAGTHLDVSPRRSSEDQGYDVEAPQERNYHGLRVGRQIYA